MCRILSSIFCFIEEKISKNQMEAGILKHIYMLLTSMDLKKCDSDICATYELKPNKIPWFVV